MAVVSQGPSYNSHSKVETSHECVVEALEDAGLAIHETHIAVARLLAGVADARLFHFELVQSCPLVVASSGRSSRLPPRCVVQVEAFLGVVSELHADELQRVVDGVVALEVQEPCRTAHRADRSHEWNSSAGVKQSAGSASLHRQIRFLRSNHLSRLLRVGVIIVLLANSQKIGLARRACVLAPHPLNIDGADIAAPRQSSQGRIQLLKILIGEFGIGLVAADISADIVLAGLHCVVDGEGLSVVDIGQSAFRLTVDAFGFGGADEEDCCKRQQCNEMALHRMNG